MNTYEYKCCLFLQVKYFSVPVKIYVTCCIIYKDTVYIRHYTEVLTSSLSAITVLLVAQVVGSSMPLVGEHQAEDRQLIADMVLTEMNQLAEKEANTPQRPTTIQPSQV